MKSIEKIKTFARLTIPGLVLFFMATHYSHAQPDTLSILHITDLHIIFNLDSYQKDLAQKRQHYGQGVLPLRHFLKKMPGKTNSDLVIATGDLVDCYEVETIGGNMAPFHARKYRRLLNSCRVPVFLTLGNHDITSYTWKDNAIASNQNNAEKARTSWTGNLPCFKNGTYYSETYNVGSTAYRLIFVDNSYNRFSPEENIVIPYVDKSQLHWLKDELQKSDEDVEIIFMHLPLTSSSPQSGSSNELYALLAKNPSVRLIIAGHNHKNDVQDFPSAEGKKLVQVKTGAFAIDPINWRQIRLTEKDIMVSAPGKTQTEITIPVN